MEEIENMGFINPAVAEESCEELEPVTYLNVQELLRNVSRPKEFGRLAVKPNSSKVILGRWERPFVDGDLLYCFLEGEEADEADRILREQKVLYISSGHVRFENEECPVHHRERGTGDCNCEER